MKSSLSFNSQPRFVASGDINNDHHIDIVVTNSGTNTIAVFIGQGNGSFGKQQTYSTGAGSHPHSVAINDFNNDSYVDIVVTNYDTNSIGVFLGHGNGTFDQQKLMSLGSSHPLFVTAADFNKDNRIDIAVVNNGTNTVSILLGYGNGSFQQQITYFTGYDSLPSSLAVGDFNNDTHLDIAVANYGTNNIGIFLNYGNGTFTNQQIYTTTINSNPSSIALSDFNNDTILDIVVANYGSGSVGIFFGHGNGTFLPQISYLISYNAYPQYVTVSIFNTVDAVDIIIVDSKNDHIHVLPGYGNGSFGTIATYDTVSGSMPVWITVDDFNNNSQADVVIVNYDDNDIVVLMDYFAKPSTRQTHYHGDDLGVLNLVAVNDINDDGIFDIVFIEGHYIGILIGRGNSTFDQQRPFLINEKSHPLYLCSADVNSDNQMDIILADTGLDSVVVFLGYGNGSFGAMLTYSTGVGSGPGWVALGDFNGDNVVDMVSANTGTYSIGILLGNGNGSFTLTSSYLFVSSPLSVAVGDIDNDNRLDIVVSTVNGEVVIYLGQGNSTFIIMGIYITGLYYKTLSINLGNFNGDNDLDIVVANTYTTILVFYLDMEMEHLHHKQLIQLVLDLNHSLCHCC